MWDIESIIRQHNSFATDTMMAGRQVNEAETPLPPAWALAVLSDKLQTGPPLLTEIGEMLKDYETGAKFLSLVQKFLFEHTTDIMLEKRRQRVRAFCYWFAKKYYPLPANTNCPMDHWIYGMPMQLLGLGYSSYHELNLRPGYIMLLSLLVYPFEGDDRDEEDDRVPFDPLDVPKENWKPNLNDIQWLRGMVAQLAVGGEWIAPMGFSMTKVAPKKIELRQAKNTAEVKEVIRRTLLIAKKIGIEAEVPRNGRTAEEKLNGAKVPLFDKLKDLVGPILVEHIPLDGWLPEEMHKMTDNTKYQGVAEFADWAFGCTGTVLLDSTYENCDWVEGSTEPMFKWTKRNVDILTKEWPIVEGIRKKIDHIVEWLEADRTARFQELLDFLVKNQPKRTAKRNYAYDPTTRLCDLDQADQGDEEDDDDE